jgi:23S rRNA U2552 (ribose-2'-O)-methylase RlmE/FtsJ
VALIAIDNEALARIAARGIDIATVIDVGASDGHWSAIAERSGRAPGVILSKPSIIGCRS